MKHISAFPAGFALHDIPQQTMRINGSTGHTIVPPSINLAGLLQGRRAGEAGGAGSSLRGRFSAGSVLLARPSHSEYPGGQAGMLSGNACALGEACAFCM